MIPYFIEIWFVCLKHVVYEVSFSTDLTMTVHYKSFRLTLNEMSIFLNWLHFILSLLARKKLVITPFNTHYTLKTKLNVRYI